MKHILAGLLFLISFNLFAQSCEEILLDNHTKDSVVLTIDSDLLVQEYPFLNLAKARMAIEQSLQKIGCSNFDIHKANALPLRAICKSLIKSLPTSRSCYIEIADGYFMVSEDMLGKVFMVFSRWD